MAKSLVSLAVSKAVMAKRHRAAHLKAQHPPAQVPTTRGGGYAPRKLRRAAPSK